MKLCKNSLYKTKFIERQQEFEQFFLSVLKLKEEDDAYKFGVNPCNQSDWFHLLYISKWHFRKQIQKH